MSPGFVPPMVMDGSGRGRGEHHANAWVADACVTEQDQWDSGNMMAWRGMHNNGKNGLVVLNNTLNVQRCMDKMIQPEVVAYVQGDGLTFQQHSAFRFSISICLTQDFPKANAVRTLPCIPSSIVEHRDLTDRPRWPLDPPQQTVA